ncbi:hypothetical protein SEMRO_2934_G340510.1 [Seminavis robusta]|uniref:Uncharacterized protein n=1 Tax=Seminavis robusta TaxID=568900 RepID=A0A9N8HYN9_9STRA|nr:hypothetical protein SEMRO_2934_G340510.1 [Seminavis robusta]|eukprot:Sro2934_g340510.1 n/a (183) ;mRNA; r:8929-9561
MNTNTSATGATGAAAVTRTSSQSPVKKAAKKTQVTTDDELLHPSSNGGWKISGVLFSQYLRRRTQVLVGVDVEIASEQTFYALDRSGRKIINEKEMLDFAKAVKAACGKESEFDFLCHAETIAFDWQSRRVGIHEKWVPEGWRCCCVKEACNNGSDFCHHVKWVARTFHRQQREEEAKKQSI